MSDPMGKIEAAHASEAGNAPNPGNASGPGGARGSNGVPAREHSDRPPDDGRPPDGLPSNPRGPNALAKPSKPERRTPEGVHVMESPFAQVFKDIVR